MNLQKTLEQFETSYLSATAGSQLSVGEAKRLLSTFSRLVSEEIETPSQFRPYHERVRSPFDYYRFGLDFFRPLLKFPESGVYGQEHLQTLLGQLDRRDNVILLANHQTEPDPQIISILLEKEHPKFAEEMIFVAGHKVTSDPVAIPFSKGRNLLCIYSKRYIEHPPEQKEEKTLHNRRALDILRGLLQEGGKCVYVAPSGGRDRMGPQGEVEVAPFDAASLELFRLMAQDTPTHFYPFAMDTYALLPPPESVQKELGEKRKAALARVAIAFGSEIDMEAFSGDKREKREARSAFIYGLVNDLYQRIKQC